jgi:hypothetical protein
MKIVSTCILPAKVGDVEIGGSECRSCQTSFVCFSSDHLDLLSLFVAVGVVYFDNAYKFSLPRLVQLISSKIVGALQQADAANPEQPVLETHFECVAMHPLLFNFTRKFTVKRSSLRFETWVIFPNPFFF